MDFIDSTIDDLQEKINNNNRKIRELKKQLMGLEEENNNLKSAIDRKENALSDKKIVMEVSQVQTYCTNILVVVRELSADNELLNNCTYCFYRWKDRKRANRDIKKWLEEYKCEKVIVTDYELDEDIEKMVCVEYVS